MDIEESKAVRKAEVDLHHIKLKSLPSSVHVIKHHNGLVAVGRQNGVVQVYQDRSFRELRTHISCKAQVTGIAFVDQSTLLVGYLNGVVNLFETTFPTKSFSFSQGISVFGLEKVNEELYVVACSDGSVKVLRVDDGITMMFTTPSSVDTQTLSVTVIEDVVYATYSNGSIKSFKFKAPFSLILHQSINLQPVQTLAKSKVPVPWVVKASSSYIFVGTSNGAVHVFERKFLTEVKKIQTHQAAIVSGAVSDEFAVFSGVDTKLALISLSSLNIISEMRGQTNDVFALDAVDANRIISSGANCDLCVFSVDQQKPVFRAQADLTPQQVQVHELKKQGTSSIIVVQNNYENIQICSESAILTQIETPDLVAFVKLSEKCNYLVYSHQSQSVVIQLFWDGLILSDIKRMATLEPMVEATFGPNNEIYFINRKGTLQKYNLSTKLQSHFANTGLIYPTQLFIHEKFITVTSIRDESIQTYSLEDQNLQEASLSLTNHSLVSLNLVQTNQTALMAIYHNNRFSVFFYEKSTGWRLTPHSKSYQFQFPNDFLKMDPVYGTATDGVDDKRLLLWTNHSIIRVHMRGKPPTEITTIENHSPKQTLDSNFAVLKLDHHLIGLYQLQKVKGKCQRIASIEWDKEASFADLPSAFDAKKYRA